MGLFFGPPCRRFIYSNVTVTEAPVLCLILEDRGRITVNPHPGARRQNETVMFSDHDETSPSIAAVSAYTNHTSTVP